MGKRKTFRLYDFCLSYLDGYDGRTGPENMGKSARVRSGIALECLLSESYSPDFASKVSKMVREGDRRGALRTLHNRIMEDLNDGDDTGDPSGTSDAVGGDSAPRSDDVGNGGDDVGGALSPVPRVEGNAELEGSQTESRSSPTGNAAGETGEDSGASGGGSDGSGIGLGNGYFSKKLGLTD